MYYSSTPSYLDGGATRGWIEAKVPGKIITSYERGDVWIDESIIPTKTIYFMKKTLKKTGYESPRCERVSISPQSQLLQVLSNSPDANVDPFVVYEENPLDPYFG